jgi:hypothetical protein
MAPATYSRKAKYMEAHPMAIDAIIRDEKTNIDF